MVAFFANNFFSKSILGFQFWTFIFVHFQKIQRLFEKYCKNAFMTIMLWKYIFKQKLCDCNFLYILAKKLKNILS